MTSASIENRPSALSIQEAARQTGLSEPTLRSYEQVGIIGPVPRDKESGYRRFPAATVSMLQSLACLRATGMSVADLRRSVAVLERGDAAAEEQRDIYAAQAERLASRIARMHLQLDYLRAKADLWDAREREDVMAEERARTAVLAIADQLNQRPPAGAGSTDGKEE